MKTEESYVFKFGQYNNKSIEEVYSIDPKYLIWLLDEFKPRYFGDEKDKVKLLLYQYKNLYFKTHTITDKSKHIGRVGDKLTIQSEIYHIYTSKPNWQGDKIYKLIDKDENKYVIKNIDTVFSEIRKGDQVNLHAKIIGHKEEMGVKITELKILP
jgi:hypothetical protein